MFDYLIVNGTIIDGTGQPGGRADVAVVGDGIASIGQLGDLVVAGHLDDLLEVPARRRGHAPAKPRQPLENRAVDEPRGHDQGAARQKDEGHRQPSANTFRVMNSYVDRLHPIAHFRDHVLRLDGQLACEAELLFVLVDADPPPGA